MFCTRAGLSLQAQASRLQFCPKAGHPLGTKDTVLLRINKCGSIPLLSAPHFLFSTGTYFKRSEKIPGATKCRWREWIWLTGPSGLHPSSPTGVKYQSHQGKFTIKCQFWLKYTIMFLSCNTFSLEVGNANWSAPMFTKRKYTDTHFYFRVITTRTGVVDTEANARPGNYRTVNVFLQHAGIRQLSWC